MVGRRIRLMTMRRKQLETEGQRVSDERDRAMRVARKLTALVEGVEK